MNGKAYLFFLTFSFVFFVGLCYNKFGEKKQLQAPDDAMELKTTKVVFEQVPAKINREEKYEKKFDWSN